MISGKPDISIVITAHREGMLAGVTAKSADASISFAADHGLVCETIIILDRSDDLTSGTLRGYFADRARFFESDLGDPGLARNLGVQQAYSEYCTFLDADDLWSENWLVEAHKLIQDRPDVIAHSACNIVFGEENLVWWHTDSESPLCDSDYLEWMNYWDALAFARTTLLKKFPFKANDMSLGYGHEDWHWNKVTLYSGVPHKPVPETIHFKRRRGGSQSAKVETGGGVPWPVMRSHVTSSEPSNL